MHCWTKDGKIYTVLPGEFEEEEMGAIYKMSWLESDTYFSLRNLAETAAKTLASYERSLAFYLEKEQGE